MSAPRIGVAMHGVRLTLEADHAPLLDFAARHLDGLVTAPATDADLVVHCRWSEGDWDETANPFAVDRPLDRIGKRMLGDADQLIWLDTQRMQGLQLRMRREPTRWSLDVAYRFHPSAKPGHSGSEYAAKKYFALMSPLVYNPMIWLMERTRGRVVLHASALSGDSGGLLIGGLGGVGKTTLCIALMQRAGFALGAENLVLIDGESVFPVYEPIRLDPNSLALLGAGTHGLVPMAFPSGLKGKDLFHVAPEARVERIAPRALILPVFTAARGVRRLEPDLVLERLVAMNRLVLELDDYAATAAAFDLHWPRAGLAQQRLDCMREFVRRTECFELGIDRAAGLDAAVEDILRCLD